MANSTANKKKKNKSEKGSKSLYIVEENIYGRGFSDDQSIEFALMEFLAFLFGLEMIDGYSSRLESVGHMMSLRSIALLDKRNCYVEFYTIMQYSIVNLFRTTLQAIYGRYGGIIIWIFILTNIMKIIKINFQNM